MAGRRRISAGCRSDWTFDITGDVIAGYLNETPVFRVVDSALPTGAPALYAASNNSARFEDIEFRVAPLHAHALFEDRFALGDMSAWTVRDDGSSSAPSSWSVVGGALQQTSEIFTQPIDRNTLDKPGTMLLPANGLARLRRHR